MDFDKLGVVVWVCAAVDVFFEMVESLVEHLHVSEARASVADDGVFAENV